jgi:hypothetical protein
MLVDVVMSIFVLNELPSVRRFISCECARVLKPRERADGLPQSEPAVSQLGSISCYRAAQTRISAAC